MDTETSAALYREVTVSGLGLGLVAAILAVTLPLSLIIGFRFGAVKRKRLHERQESVSRLTGDTSLNAILTLLGLLLAFTFGNSLSVFQSVKSALTDEASALGTVFLRADYLPDPGRTELQKAILDYARTRVVPGNDPLETPAQVTAFLDASLRAQAPLWPLTLEATADPVPPPIQAFVAGGMNTALDAHLYRVETFAVPVSPFTQAILLAAALVACYLVGSQAGLAGQALTWRPLIFALFLGAIMYTIVDIRRSAAGLIRVDQSPMIATIGDMERSLAGR